MAWCVQGGRDEWIRRICWRHRRSANSVARISCGALFVTPQRAAEVLGLLPAEATSLRSIHVGYAREMKRCHPDTAMERTIDAAAQIRRLKDARSVLLALLDKQALVCKLCGGAGQVRYGIARRQCANCNGTGEARSRRA